MSELLEKQILFSRMWTELMVWALTHGYRITLGEAYRPPGWAAVMAEKGLGIRRSLHCLRLAHDINLFDEDGRYLTEYKYYEPIGVQWELMGGAWGGRFTKNGKPWPDVYHFSLPHGGRK